MGQLARSLAPLLGFVLFGVALWIINDEVQKVGLERILHALRGIPTTALLTAAALTPLCYLLLASYDLLGFRYIQHRLRYRRILFAAFIGYAFSNNISMTPSVAARYRIYSSWGVSKLELAQLIAFHILSTWLGFFAVGGVIVLIHPRLPLLPGRAVGAVMLACLAAYFVASHFRKHPFHIRRFELCLPSQRLIVLQLALGSLDWALTGVVLYVLLPAPSGLTYQHFLGAYLAAQLVQMASHVPGGLGVFESTILVLLRPSLPTPAILGSLIAYRVVYNVAPLVVASILLGGFEVRQRFRRHA